MKLKTIEEYNKEKQKFYDFMNNNRTGIACPQCGDEMLETNPGVILTSNPPQKNVHCPTCKYKSYILA